MPTELAQVLQSISELKIEIKADMQQSEARIEARLDSKIDAFNERFDNYQKATQSLVFLAFGIIASATLIIIVSSIFRR
jgi:hypothetical protein